MHWSSGVVHDNKSSMDLAINLVFHGHSKHIDIHYVLLYNVLKKELDIIVKHISTDDKHADILTKALATSTFEKL